MLIAVQVTNAVMLIVIACILLNVGFRFGRWKKYFDQRIENLKMEKDAQIAALERIITKL